MAESHPYPPLTSTVHEALRQSILSGALAPNEHVNQDRVARELGVSRTPIREALRWLERDGLVRMEPNRGAFVQAFTRDDVFEIYELRELLEPHAAGIAAAVATRADVQAVRSLEEQIAALRGDLQEAFELNRAFHEALCAPCRNGLLMGLLGQVWRQGSALRIFTHYAQAGPDLRERTAEQHRAIVEAFGARNAERTRELVRVHIAEAHDTTARLMARTSEEVA